MGARLSLQAMHAQCAYPQNVSGLCFSEGPPVDARFRTRKEGLRLSRTSIVGSWELSGGANRDRSKARWIGLDKERAGQIVLC